MSEATIFNIQRCSVHDGPGIRTTIFFKGCPLTCAWCHNPESQNFKKEVWYDEEKCGTCTTCMKICPNGAITVAEDAVSTDMSKCTMCDTCTDFCISEAREVVGCSYTVDELAKVVEKDKTFFQQTKGGITLSGGEVMMQIDFLEKFVKKISGKGLSVAIDTCGYAPQSHFERIRDHVDLFLYDVKLSDDKKHQEYTGKSNGLIFDNLRFLSEQNARIILRIPLIEPVNCDEEEIINLIKRIQGVQVEEVNLLPFHNYGRGKYKRANLACQFDEFSAPSQEKMDWIADRFRENGYIVKVGG